MHYKGSKNEAIRGIMFSVVKCLLGMLYATMCRNLCNLAKFWADKVSCFFWDAGKILSKFLPVSLLIVKHADSPVVR